MPRLQTYVQVFLSKHNVQMAPENTKYRRETKTTFFLTFPVVCVLWRHLQTMENQIVQQ